MENLTKVSTIGTNFAFAGVGMAIIGVTLDYFAKTSPRWLLGCLAFGLIGGGYRFIRDALTANKRAAAGAARRRHAPYIDYSTPQTGVTGPISTLAPHHPTGKPHHRQHISPDGSHPNKGHHGTDADRGAHTTDRSDGGDGGGSGGDGDGGGGDGGGGD